MYYVQWLKSSIIHTNIVTLYCYLADKYSIEELPHVILVKFYQFV